MSVLKVDGCNSISRPQNVFFIFILTNRSFILFILPGKILRTGSCLHCGPGKCPKVLEG